MTRLAGQRIVVTRSAEDASEWAERLERVGAVPIVYPCIRTEIIDTPELRRRLGTDLASADWLVFTSRRGVEALAAFYDPRHDHGIHGHATPSSDAVPQIATVGPATADAARTQFGRIDLVGPGTAAALGAALARRPEVRAGAACLLALAENAGTALEDALAEAGAKCLRHNLYRTVPSRPRVPKEPLSAIQADQIIFASPTAVTGFLNQVAIDADLRAVTIGPATSAAARAHGLAVAAEAAEPSLDSILESLDA